MFTQIPARSPDPASVSAERSGRLKRLREVIQQATQSLPAQGPITVFIHHNPLHSMEDAPFDEAVVDSVERFGCEPYLTEDAFRKHFEHGRIVVDDLTAVLSTDLGSRADHRVAGLGSVIEIRRAMLTHSLRTASSDELRWFVAETDALRRFRPGVVPPLRRRMIDAVRRWALRDGVDPPGPDGPLDGRLRASLQDLLEPFRQSTADVWSERTWEALTLQTLWRVCLYGAHTAPPARVPRRSGLRPRDWLFDATGEDADLLVNDLLVPFCAAFLDQGFARWPLPDRLLGFWGSFAAIYGQDGGPLDSWRRGLAAEIGRIQTLASPIERVEESLALLGIAEADWAESVISTLLALRGWAGMIWQMEIRQDRAAAPAPVGSLIEFLAVRLMLDRLATSHVARERLGYRGSLADLRRFARLAQPKAETSRVESRAFVLFQLAQAQGWSPLALASLTKVQWVELFSVIDGFPALERRRVWQLAFERRYRLQSLDALALHKPRKVGAPRFQAIFCLDEREESFRRHLEETSPNVETYGVAGFFAVAMYYRGADEAHFVPLCPIAIRPRHWVIEELNDDESAADRVRLRRVLGRAWHQYHVGSRGVTAGALLAAATGALATLPMVARVLFPRLTAALWRRAGGWIRPPGSSTLRLERSAAMPGDHGPHLGYSLDERTNIAERLLRDIGLTRDIAPLVLVVGHGSTSLNNPHKSAYDCGACGGNCGGPNARAAARILNDPEVRKRLANRGIVIPEGTAFIGAWHNTCNDSLSYFDVERVPEERRADFDCAAEALEEVCDRNAHERCRRFLSAPLDMTPAAARRHVEGRAEDLAQTRPECGHASNALCIVGRRERTRGLYLDRRAFLTSYDPDQDDAQRSILTRVLQAAVPVCAGINLEYYFSFVDPTGWGCGTKLPHNVASLLGIMDGARSDLRPGLPWQMVEIHEPVRLLFVLECTPEDVQRILERNPAIAELVRHNWVQLATLDPDSQRVHAYEDGYFTPHHVEAAELPRVARSMDWYRGWREHLGFAEIGPGSQEGAGR